MITPCWCGGARGYLYLAAESMCVGQGLVRRPMCLEMCRRAGGSCDRNRHTEVVAPTDLVRSHRPDNSLSPGGGPGSGWVCRGPKTVERDGVDPLVGISARVLGAATARGLVLYFVAAAAAHVRARDAQLVSWVNWPSSFTGSGRLVLALAYRGPA